MNKKWLAIVLIIVVMAIAATIEYLILTQRFSAVPQAPAVEQTPPADDTIIDSSDNSFTSDATAVPLAASAVSAADATAEFKNWVVYRNESCGFEIKYPASYIEITEMENCPPDYDYQEPIQVIALTNLAGCYEETANEQALPGCQLHNIIISGDKTKIAGKEIAKTIAQLDNSIGEKIVAADELDPALGKIVAQTQKDKAWYRYELSFNLNNRKNAEQILDKILYTFKFLR